MYIICVYYLINRELLFVFVCVSHFRIVAKVNDAIGEDENAEALIGVLDIYGFEDFKNNGCASYPPCQAYKPLPYPKTLKP